jgi:hypothetical protein
MKYPCDYKPMRKPNNKASFLIWILIFVFVCLFGVIGNAERKDEIAYQNKYCNNVKLGVWPDFKNQYKEVCTTLANN